MNRIFLLVIALLVMADVNAYAQIPTDTLNPAESANVVISQSTVNAIDPSPSANPTAAYYPGFRAGNQLIVYTPAYGTATGTNEFGQEATVVNGVVVKLSGSNSYIPNNGFVISGHGKAKQWINNNIIVGSKINLDKTNKIIESVTSSESYLFQANYKFREVKSVLEQYRAETGYSAQMSENYLEKTGLYIDNASKEAGKGNFNSAKELANMASVYADKAFH